jgi:hypothetical protein
MARLVIIGIILTFLGVNAYAQPKISFDNKTIKFNKVKAGEILHFDFFFENTGTNEPLIISDIKVTCPCTQFEYPKEPIFPGEKKQIKVTFDTKGKIGYQDRTLEVFTNVSNNPFTLRFKGMVDNKEK